MIIMKMNNEKTYLCLILNMKHRNQKKTQKIKDKNMKCEKSKCKQIFIVIKYENVNIKGIEQGYGIRLYLKLVMNKLKVIRGPTSICTSLRT